MQMQLFASTPTEPPQDATWVTGAVVAREGVDSFLHLVRSPSDPTRLSREERKGRECAWKNDLRKSSKGRWLAGMQELLSDGQPRTFNRIVLELSSYEYTADVAFDTVADDALWDLVGAQVVEHTLATPVLFRGRDSSVE